MNQSTPTKLDDNLQAEAQRYAVANRSSAADAAAEAVAPNPGAEIDYRYFLD